MKKLWLLAILAALPLVAQDKQNSCSADEAALEQEKLWMKIAQDVIPKTVVIEFKLEHDIYAAAGSGAIVTPDGHVVTCAHVAEAIDIQKPGTPYTYSIVTMDGKRHPAKLLGKNSNNDIALMKFDGKDLPHFTMAEDSRPAKDDLVLALGFPMGNVGLGRLPEAKNTDVLVHPSLAIGQVSEGSAPFLIMSPGVKKYYPDSIESDTPVFMGNSGGPLVNKKGELVGLNAAIIPASNKTYSLSTASILKAYDTLKEGKNVAGIEPDMPDAVQKMGRTLWDALGTNFSFSEAPAARPYLREPFKKMAAGRKNGVVKLYRGEKPCGYATLLDEKGTAITSIHAIDRTSIVDKLFSEIEKRAGDNETLKELWDSAKGFLEESSEIFAELSDGSKVPVKIEKRSKEQKLALLKLQIDKKTNFIPKRLKGATGPGQWVAAIGTDEDAIGVGLLSTDAHTVRGAVRFPGSFREAWDVFTKDSKGLEGYDMTDVILHDVTLRHDQLGSPLLDSQGRVIGVNVYHVCRGVSYAVSIAAAMKALGIDPFQ
jgi:S1-C subfamily serine protease